MLLVQVPPEAEEAVRWLVKDDPLFRLRGIRRAREQLTAAEGRAVAEAREQGATWKRIGSVYGVTAQTAQQRFRAAVSARGHRLR